MEQLFKRYLNDQVSPDELKILISYFDIDENEELLKELIAKVLETFNYPDAAPDSDTRVILDRIFKHIQKNKKK